ncbi:MAG TPA: division/cell wall cluster transcriptional repressor MraZ [Steroidobacteraceae bacterium]|nr:division/cell wall cluster transcriptional repressor MraZ [Steroidobacteraceae bacterium]
MFRGANPVTLDAKGRLAMPTRFRDQIAARSHGHLVMTVDLTDRCLLIYTSIDWEVIEQKLINLPALNPAARRAQRLLLGHLSEVELDANGRALVAPFLREYAGITRDAVLVGQGVRFELWDEKHWNESRAEWLKAEQGDEPLPPELASLTL